MRPLKVDFIGFDLSASRRCRLQQRSELGHRPLTVSNFAETFAGHRRRIDLECPAERRACCDDSLLLREEQQRFVR